MQSLVGNTVLSHQYQYPLSVGIRVDVWDISRQSCNERKQMYETWMYFKNHTIYAHA